MTSSTPKITTGDDARLYVTLKKNSAIFLINPTATVKAVIIKPDTSVKLCDEVLQLSSTSGADWGNSLVVVEFPSTVTGPIKRVGAAQVEIQVDDAGKQTWFVDIELIRGNID